MLTDPLFNLYKALILGVITTTVLLSSLSLAIADHDEKHDVPVNAIKGENLGDVTERNVIDELMYRFTQNEEGLARTFQTNMIQVVDNSNPPTSNVANPQTEIDTRVDQLLNA